MPITTYNRFRWNKKDRRARRKAFRKQYPTSNYLIKQINGIRTLMNVETKHLDTFSAGASMTSGGTVDCLSLMAQGSTASGRNGQQVKFLSVNGKYQITRSTSATSDSSTVRVMVFRYNNNAGSLPAVTDILESANPLSFNDIDESANFTVVHDRMYILDDQNPSRIVKFFRKVQSRAKYDGTAANISGTVSGQYFILYVSDEATYYPSLTYQTRLRYVDN